MERNRLKAICTECDMMMAQSYLKKHTWPVYMASAPPQISGVNEKGEGPTTYMVLLPRILQSVRFPVPGCPVVSHRAGRLWENFMFIKFWSHIAVVQERKEPLPHCDLCGMHMPEGRLIKNFRIERCDRNMQMRWWTRDVEIEEKCKRATLSITREDGA